MLLEGGRRSYTTFGIILVSAVLLHIWLHYFLFTGWGWNLDNLDNILAGFWVVLGVLATELCLVINFRAAMLLAGNILQLAFYGGILWGMYVLFT